MAHKEFICSSKNGIRVVFDPVDSHTAIHFDDTPGLRELVMEVLEKTELKGHYVEFETDMGRIIGTSDGVKVDETDEIVYAKRLKRDVYTPFTKSQQATPTTLVSMCLVTQADGSYQLLSAWLGSCGSPDFPGGDNETPDSKAYWTTHALVWGNQAVQVGTETTICPW